MGQFGITDNTNKCIFMKSCYPANISEFNISIKLSFMVQYKHDLTAELQRQRATAEAHRLLSRVQWMYDKQKCVTADW